jgi:hypothetical protein
MEENVKKSRETIESWIEGFDMVRGDDGLFSTENKYIVDRHRDLVERHDDLVRRWSKLVPLYKATVRKNPSAAPSTHPRRR